MKQLNLTFLALLLSYISFAVTGPITGSNHVCMGNTTTLGDGTTGGVWSSSDGTIASVGFSSGVVTGAAVGTATITYTAGGTYATLAFTVNALPGVFAVSGGGYCAGDAGGTINLSGSETGANYQLYKSGSPVGAPVAGTGAVINWGPYTAPGTYIVIATNPTTGCTRNMSGSGSVVMNPLPTAYTLYTPGSGVLCAGTSGHIYLSGSQTDVNYQLYIGSTLVGVPVPGTGSIIDFGPVSLSGTYTVEGISTSTGCGSTMSGSVTLTTLPAPGPIIGPSGVCAGSIVTLTDTTAGGTWSSSNTAVATISTGGMVTGVATGTTTISYTSFSGCTSTSAFSVANLVLPITGASSVCTGSFTTLSDASAGGTWTSTNPAAATIDSGSGLVSGLSSGTTTVSYTLGGCGYASTPITVNVSPAIVTGVTSVCAGGTTSLADATPGGAWSSSNTAVGTVGTTGIVTTISAGSSSISYALPTGCASSVVLSVDPPPVITGATSVCVGNTTTLFTSIAGSWTSSNPFVASITSGGVITGVAPGTVVITCNSFSTGCVSNHNITVSSSCSGVPVAGAANVVNTDICAGNADLLYLSGASSSCGVTFQWQSSTDSVYWTTVTGAANDSFIANPASPVYYRCKATCFTSGLYAYSDPVHVQVYNNITAHSIISIPSYYCNGPDFHVVTCGVQPASNIMSYYGDGTADSTHITIATNDISHTYSMPGTYTVKQVLRNGVTPQDSVSYTFSYSYCRTLPVFFYFDANNNCIADDPINLYNPITTEVDSNGVPVDTIVAINGFYYKALGVSGTVYRFKVIAYDAGLHMSCPATGILYDTITAYANNYSPLYFGFNCSSSTAFNLGISTSMVCGRHTATGFVYVGNSYCTVENPVVTMTFSPNYNFGSSWPAPYSVVGNVVTWHLSDVTSYNGYGANIHFQLDVPGPFLTAGDTIQTNFTVTPLTGDVYTPNNYAALLNTIMASYDPNGITVLPGGKVISCTPLQYAIHFENTGNDTAYNISVVDTLPDNVNASSLKVISATSVVNLVTSTYSGHTVVKFDFPHIYLPDSSHHDVCQGEVVFSLNAKAGLADGSTIANHASVYFDDNLPVLTDTVTNVIGISPIVGTGSICAGATTALADTSAGGTWSSANTHATITGGLLAGITAGTDTISYTLTNTCGTKVAKMPVTVNPVVVPAVSITPSTGMGDTICTGATPEFAAVPVNGGTAPVYQWMINGMDVSTDSTYTYIPENGDVVSVELTSNKVCVAPDTAVATMVLNVLAPNAPIDSMVAIPGILISPGMADTFVAIITNNGPATFEWLLNGLPTGDTTDTFITHTLVDKDSVTCITTATDLCKLSSFNSFIITVSTVGVDQLATIGGVMVYPNPNKGEFTIQGTLTAHADEDVSVEISDMVGQVVYADKIMATGGRINKRISLNNVANGMYLLTLRSGSESKVYHFVVEQ